MLFNLIQIALVGNTPVVVEEGLRKSIPEKLYLVHTKDETNYKYETEAKKLRKKIVEEFRISVILIKVHPFDMDENIKAILTIISKERKNDASLTKTDFSVNITGGTKLMVASASTAAYLAGSKVYYVMDPSKYRGNDLVKELPMPIRPENDDRGNTSRTTAIIIGIIKKLGKCTNGRLLDEVRKDRSLNRKQRIEYHLKKLLEHNLITITVGWEKPTRNIRTGKPNIDYKKRTIQLTALGEYYAAFPGLMGNLA